MLIYCNSFKIIGDNSEQKVFTSISGWIKRVTKQKLGKSQLQSGDDFSFGEFFIRCLKSIDSECKLYSIRLSHPDREVNGREWISEIGIKVSENEVYFSLVVETFERSTLVTEIPVSTRPLLISYLQKNCTFDPETLGFNCKVVRHEQGNYSLRGFKEEVLNENRRHPIVLISKSNQNNFFDSNILQEHLFGLAQVVELDENINSWDLENLMGSSQLCAWDGAINIIFPILKDGGFSNKLFSRNNLIEVNKIDRNALFRTILSNITHYTNIKKKNDHITSTEVKINQLKNQRLSLRQKLVDIDTNRDNNDNSEDYKSIAEDAYSQLELQEETLVELKDSHKKERLELQSKVDYLESRIENLQTSGTETGRTLIKYGNENNLYKNEILLIVLSILSNYKENLERNTRRYDVINDIVSTNTYDNNIKNKIDELKNVFKGYRSVDKKIKNCIDDLGLRISEEGPHNKLEFKQDTRYSVTFAKTASDHRAGDNIVRDIKKQLL